MQRVHNSKSIFDELYVVAVFFAWFERGTVWLLELLGFDGF